ncbi:hypothetical protein VNO77_23374 [Canavalia gladiata]|uniref:Uncharacterized protein n=1 Tax=Canavalia gladiata TaxID=3824 RepID=A0AAN9QFA8_CANGL
MLVVLGRLENSIREEFTYKLEEAIQPIESSLSFTSTSLRSIVGILNTSEIGPLVGSCRLMYVTRERPLVGSPPTKMVLYGQRGTPPLYSSSRCASSLCTPLLPPAHIECWSGSGHLRWRTGKREAERYKEQGTWFKALVSSPLEAPEDHMRITFILLSTLVHRLIPNVGLCGGHHDRVGFFLALHLEEEETPIPPTMCETSTLALVNEMYEAMQTLACESGLQYCYTY